MTKVIRRKFGAAMASQNFKSHYAEFVATRSQEMKKEKRFEHSLHKEGRPINTGIDHIMRQADDVVGVEMVSSHYESFSVSRKFALISIGLFFTVSSLSKTADLNWVMSGMASGMPSYFMLAVILCEIPKYIILPNLNNFYYLTYFNELKMLQEDVPVRVQDVVNRNMKQALGQFDYLFLHKKFKAVKEQSVANFLRNQELELKQKLMERAQNLLVLAAEAEALNRKEILSKIIETINKEVEEMRKKPSKEQLDSAFKAALVGIKKGSMNYEGDSTLPYIIGRIREEVNKVKNMKPEESVNKT